MAVILSMSTITSIATSKKEQVSLRNNQGKQGCKNVRAGGDTVDVDMVSSGDRFMTYIVYRSFRHPPQIAKPEGASMKVASRALGPQKG